MAEDEDYTPKGSKEDLEKAETKNVLSEIKQTQDPETAPGSKAVHVDEEAVIIRAVKEDEQEQHEATGDAAASSQPEPGRCGWCRHGKMVAAVVSVVLTCIVVLGVELGVSSSVQEDSNSDRLVIGTASPPPPAYLSPRETPPDTGGDVFEEYKENDITNTTEVPISTFSADVDTASYSYVRRLLLQQYRWPSPETVRAEEFINYFDYPSYPQPVNSSAPFAPTIMVSASPWNTNKHLLHIGIKGYDIDPAERPATNLVFLVDVSGSMDSPDKLPLAKTAIQLLLEILEEHDHVGIVTYATKTKVALAPTAMSKDGKAKALAALGALQAGGRTSGEGGIQLAYQLAEENFDPEAVNRILLTTDGDFNIGIRDADDLKELIQDKRDTGIFLSVLGFGMGNYHDTTSTALANHGNGVASYIDSEQEAHKVMVTEAFSTVFSIAKDVKFQIEFNPRHVSEYRLIGYEKRLLNQDDFANDAVDAGDIGSGHTVTAIYEISLMDSTAVAAVQLRNTNGPADDPTSNLLDGDYALVGIRYKLPDQDESKLIQASVSQANLREALQQDALLASVVPDFGFATAVAGFAQLLKGGTFLEDEYDLQNVVELAEANIGDDAFGYRSAFIQLVQVAQEINEPVDC